MDLKDKKEEERPVAYPKPTETDTQLQNQPEFIDEEPNRHNKDSKHVNDKARNKES